MSNTLTDIYFRQGQTEEKPEHRTESISLLVTKQLNEDIRVLTKLTNSKNSINDFIVDVLTAYVNQEENQAKITLFQKLLTEITETQK